MNTSKQKQSLGLAKYHACCRSANCAQSKRKTRAKGAVAEVKEAVAEVKKAVAEVKKEKKKLTRKIKDVIVQEKKVGKKAANAEAKAIAAVARRRAAAAQKAKDARALKLYESGQLPGMVLGAVGKLPKFNKTVERKMKKALKNLGNMQKSMKNIK